MMNMVFAILEKKKYITVFDGAVMVYQQKGSQHSAN